MNSTSNNLPLTTPLDIRLGLTDAPDVAFPLRWGILGAGRISAQWVMCLQACTGATVTAVAAREIDRAREFATRFGIASAYGNYTEMVASDDVDIVYIGTITRLHKEHTLLAIEAGKHVLCEKPLAENIADAQAMYAAAGEKDVMLQDGVWTRFFPAVEHARATIEAGTIGEVVLVQSDFFDPIYAIQAAPLAFGAAAVPTAVTALGRKASGAIVEYGGEKCAVLTFPPKNCELPEVTELIGTEGRITLERPAHCPTRISIRIPPSNGVPSQYRGNNTPAPVQHFEYPIPISARMATASPNQHGFIYQAEAIHRCLTAGLHQCPQYNKEDSLHSINLLTEINKAKEKAMQR
ncbi:MAG: Gfo/Idh/MocA family oxidoreductase [Candidatus Poribacteria bacterium]|nr:Gfo/Idh/MocA family oxidoreductase [Candidatus Poribacteria bacterium]